MMLKISGRADRCRREVGLARSRPPRLARQPQDPQLGQVGYDHGMMGMSKAFNAMSKATFWYLFLLPFSWIQ